MEKEAEIVTQEQDVSDNSDVTNQEPSNNDDNSNEDLNNGEPDKNTEADGGEQESRFKTIEDATKSFNELHKKYGEQSNEIGELRKKAELAEKLQQEIDAKKLQTAKDNGFDTVQEFENNQEVVRYEADEYAKYVNECDYPDEMVRMLAEYRNNPTEELRRAIEAEFPVDTLKKVAGNVAILKGQLQQKQNEALEEEVYNSAREYLDKNVNEYSEKFKNPAFAALYGEAFRAYGCELDTKKFIELMDNFANSVIKAAGIKNGIALENSSATDEIAGLTNTNNTLPQAQEKNILEMSEEEVRKELKKYK